MIPEELNLVLRKYEKKVFIYSWKYFTKRIHDELVRSVLEESPFFYVELNFNVVKKELELHTSAERLKYWETFFEMLLTQKRHSDLCGFLNNNDGIAFLFTDSISNIKNHNPVWNRFCEEIAAKTFFDMREWQGIIYAEYPPKEFFASNQQPANA
jgi:hypothetical protein